METSGNYRSEFLSDHINQDIFLLSPDRDGGLDELLLRSFRLKLRDYLDYEDKMSMMASIESRVPFLSLPFVQYGLAIPGDQKIHRGVRKYALREAFKEYIPEDVLRRIDKTGFASPQGQWMACLGSPIQKSLGRPNAFVRNFIRAERLDAMLGDVRTGRTTDYLLLFRIWSLEIWHRLFILGESHESLTQEMYAST